MTTLPRSFWSVRGSAVLSQAVVVHSGASGTEVITRSVLRFRRRGAHSTGKKQSHPKTRQPHRERDPADVEEGDPSIGLLPPLPHRGEEETGGHQERRCRHP